MLTPERRDAGARTDEHQRQSRVLRRPERAAAAQENRHAQRRILAASGLRAVVAGQERRELAVQPAGRNAALAAVLRLAADHRKGDVDLRLENSTVVLGVNRQPSAPYKVCLSRQLHSLAAAVCVKKSLMHTSDVPVPRLCLDPSSRQS